MKEAEVPVSEINRPRTTHRLIGHEVMTSVVDDFYDRIQRHPRLAEPFGIVDDWVEHKARLVHFWWVSLGGAPYADYRYRVAEKHLAVGITSELVDDWLELFHITLHEHLPPEPAALWFQRAQRMGRSLRMLNEFYSRKAARPPL